MDIITISMGKLICEATTILPTTHGDFAMHLFKEDSNKEHIALVKGDVAGEAGIVTRIHSECLTGDVFGCQRCDCQDQLHEALRIINKRTRGVLLYLRQEGRGIGLANKMRAYNPQDEGIDTAEANIALGFDIDNRRYETAAEILKILGVTNIDLITNNLNKVNGVTSNGITVRNRIPIVSNSTIRDRTSLFHTKQTKLNHTFEEGLLASVSKEKEDVYPFISPVLIYKPTPLPDVTREYSEQVASELQSKLGEDLLLILLQGPNMRGDGSIHDSNFDYIVFIDDSCKDRLKKIIEVKKKLKKSNLLFLTKHEYMAYPQDRRLQFFVCRKVYGKLDLGLPPSKADILKSAISYAMQIKDTLRPLIINLAESPATQDSLMIKVHECLKRFDDCFLRIVALYSTGKFPIHRAQLQEISSSKALANILSILNNWHSNTVTVGDLLDCLSQADRILNIFLRRYSKL